MTRLQKAIMEGATGPIKDVGSGAIEREFCFGPDFLGFQGHFPDYPILPAFVQIQMGMIMIGAHQSRPVELDEVKKAKFMREVHPNARMKVKCVRQKEAEAGIYEVSISIPEGMAASILLRIVRRD